MMTDAEKEQLLELIAEYIQDTAISERLVSDFAEEVAMSMDVTTQNADKYRYYIESTLRD